MIVDNLKVLKNKYPIIFLLIISFAVRICCGMYSGAADSDAGDYTTLAIQMANENNYSYIIDTTSSRQIIQLWLLIMTIFMEFLGATNFTAIFTVSLFGTLAIYSFYKLLKLFFDEKSSFLMTVLFSGIPLVISVQQNPLYDGFLLFVLLSGLYFYFKFISSHRRIYLILAGFIGSCLPFVHPSAYIYLLVMWLLYPLFYKEKDVIKTWIIFSFIIGLFPFIQILVWKHLFGSFFPYQKMVEEWILLSERGFSVPDISFKNTLNYYLVFVVSISPLIIIAIIAFIADINFKRRMNLILIFIYCTSVVLLTYFGFFNSFLRVIIPFGFVLIFKQKLLRENKFIFLCGTISLVMLSLFFGMSEYMAPQRRGFVYIITFSIPILWCYGTRLINNNGYLFSILFGFYFALFVAAFYFNLPQNQNKLFPYFNKRISVALNAYLPYYKQPDKVVQSLKWVEQQNFKSDQYLLTNFLGRYIPANLNMAQNHCLVATGETYSIARGFEEIKLSTYSQWIEKFKPEFIIWDKYLHDESYNTIDKNGKHKMSFTFRELISVINTDYSLNKSLPDSVLIYKRLNK